jgi:hypothetical protein
MIRPVDAETIQDICRDVALDNYGFLCPDGKNRLEFTPGHSLRLIGRSRLLFSYINKLTVTPVSPGV